MTRATLSVAAAVAFIGLLLHPYDRFGFALGVAVAAVLFMAVDYWENVKQD